MSNRIKVRPADEASAGDPVTVAYVMHNNVTSSWHHSMVQLIVHDFTTSGHVAQGGYIAMRCGTGNLVESRNKAIAEFLSDRDSDWLFWTDTDMGFEADVVDRLMAVADPVLRPIVGGLCFTQKEVDRDGFGGWQTIAAPTIFDWVKVESPGGPDAEVDPSTGKPRGEQQGFAIRYDYTRDAVVGCKGTGSACILIHRTVFEKIQAEFGQVWYDRIWNPWLRELTSEDLSFCMRAGMLEIPVFVHTGVRTTHAKTQWVGEDVYVQQRAITELADHFRSVPQWAQRQGGAPEAADG